MINLHRIDRFDHGFVQITAYLSAIGTLYVPMEAVLS